jgi:anti-sigma factor RsiW
VTCVDARRRLEALVDGGLDPDLTRALRLHLAGCSECAAHHRAAISLPARLRALPAPATTDLTRAVLSRVSAHAPRPELMWGLATLEAVLACLVLVQLSGFTGLASAAGGALRDAGWLLSSGTSTPAPVPANLVVLLALLALIACSAAHLALLSRGARRRLS